MNCRRWARVRSIAIELSDKSVGRSKHVSILIYKNRIVSTGINMLKTDTFAYELYKYPYVHSELNAIKNCPKKIPINKCTLLNFRVSNDRKRFLMSRPCSSCIKLVVSVGITKVFYTDQQGEIQEL